MVWEIGKTLEYRSPEVLDDLAVQAISLQLVHRLTPREIVARLLEQGADVRGPRDVIRLISRARDRGLVSVEVKTRIPECRGQTVDHTLGDRLSAVTGVRDVLVVTCFPRSTSRRGGTGDTSDEHEIDVNRHFGHVTAGYLWERIRDYDTIGLVGGRVSVRPIEYMRRIKEGSPRAFKGIRIDALVSGFNTASADEDMDVNTPRGSGTQRQEILTRSFVTNTQAMELAAVLDVPADRIRLVGLPPFLRQEQLDLIASLAPHLHNNAQLPDIVICELAVAKSLHYTDPRMIETLPELNPVIDELKLFCQLEAENTAPMLMDLACKFYWIGDSDGQAGPSGAVLKAIESFNKKRVSMDTEKLNRAKEKILIVRRGNEHYPGLLALLTDDRIPFEPTCLVIDKDMAIQLLDDLPLVSRSQRRSS